MSKGTDTPVLQGGELQDGSELQDSLLRELAWQMPVLPIPRPGERLGGRDGHRYELLGLLGTGGMGRVFQALDHKLQRTVALKFLLSGRGLPGSQGLALLREEARTIARLDHENIVRIHDVGEWDAHQGEDGAHLGMLPSIPFLVMECLTGESLGALLRRGRPELRRTLDIMRDVAAGLAHAHERNLVHRDLKPGNVFILPNGRAKVLDFGLARSMADPSTVPSLSGAGTPGYMSPEQWRGEPLDARTDTWAAGVLLFEMLTGERPFRGTSPQELRDRLLSSEPMPSVRACRPELPEEVARLVASALAKTPAERIASGTELGRRLEELREHLGLQVREPRANIAERRQVTLVSCRLVLEPGSPEGLDPEDSSELESSFHRVCMRLIQQHGGAISTCVGAEVLACFGYPRSQEDDSERAVRAALHLQEALPRELAGLGPHHLRARVGIHTDWVVLAEDTPGFHGTTPSMQGEAPGLAAWLATQAEPGAVLLSDRTRALVRGRFQLQPLGTRTFEGLAGAAPISVHRAHHELHGVSRFERALVVGALTPLVGREAELEVLAARLRDALQGQGSSLLLRGEAGIGKSRLLQELHDRDPPGASTWVHCQCWPQLKESSLSPFSYWLQRYLGLTGDDSPRRKKQRLEERLNALGLPAEHEPALASLLSLPIPEDSPFLALSPERQCGRRLQSLLTLFQRMAEAQPLILVVEDLHWADAYTLKFIEQLLQAASGARICLLLTARPEFSHAWAGSPGFHELELRPLSPDDTAAMIRAASQDPALPEETVARLVARTDGVPLFIEEVTRVMLEQGSSSRSSSGELSFTIPATLRELLLDRLDRLPPRRKALAQIAATLDREFSYDMLRAASFLGEEELLLELGKLEQAGLIVQRGEPPYATYAFKHALIQEAAYQSLPRGTRQRYHARIVQVLTEQFPEVADEQPEVLAQHSTLAGLVEQALKHWHDAGRRAVKKSAFPESIAHIHRALEQLARLPASRERDRQEIGLLNELGQVLISAKGFSAKEVEDNYTRMRALCAQTVPCDQCEEIPAGLLWGLANVPLVRGDRERTEQLIPLLMGVIAGHKDVKAMLVAHTKLATAYFWKGAYAACREHCLLARALVSSEEATRIMERIWGCPDAFAGDTLLYAHLYLSYSELMLGNIARARTASREALALAEATRCPYAVGTALMFDAALEYELGAPAAALEASGRAVALGAENGFPFVLAVGQVLHGWATARLGDVQAGVVEMKEALALIRAMGAMVLYPRKLTYLLTVYLDDGRTEEGLEAVSEALELVRTGLAREALPELLRLRGEFLLQRGEILAARDCLRQAAAEARVSGALLHELRAVLSLARLLQGSGEEAMARVCVAEVRGRFTEGMDSADYQAALRFLGEQA